MYAAKAFNESIQINNLPTTMYKAKNFYNDCLPPEASGTVNEDSDVLFQLNKQQQSHLRRLNRLKDKLNQFCDDLNLNHLIISDDSGFAASNLKKDINADSCNNKKEDSTVTVSKLNLINYSNDKLVQEQLKSSNRIKTKKNKSDSIVDDLVIQIDPSQHIPYSLFALFNKLTLNFKCFIQFFIHGTVIKEFSSASTKVNESKIRNLTNLFENLKLNLTESRNSYDYGVTIIWKMMGESAKLGPVLALNNSKNAKVYGESNILRYFNRLIKGEESVQMDEWIDKCTNDLRASNKPNFDAYAVNLSKHFGAKNKYLLGEKLTIADYYNWSVLKQSNVNLESKSVLSLKEWTKRLESTDLFVELLNTI